MRYICSCIALLTLFVLTGCSEEAAGPPSEWETTEDRWWSPTVDTSHAFRDLESLSAMGLEADEEDEGYVERRVRAELMPIFRNNPQIVDSLFDEHVVPLIENADGSDVDEQVSQVKNEGYQALRNHYREPQPALTLGEDVAWNFPDSLRQQGIGGPVRMQVYLDEEGAPQAIRLREGVHPVLDREAMRVASQMRWDPAGVRDGDDWRFVPSWTRYTIRFPTSN